MDNRFCARLLLKTFWDYVDSFVFLTMANLVTASLFLTVIGAPFGWAGMVAVAAKCAAAGDPEWSDYWRGARSGWPLAFAWLLCMGGAIGSMVAGVWFYPALLGPTAGHFAAGANVWVCLGAAAALLYALPAVALRGEPFGKALKLGLMLCAARPFYTLFALFWGATLVAATLGAYLVLVPFATFALASLGMMAMWIAPMRPHLRPVRDEAADTEGAKPRTWAEAKIREKKAEARRELDEADKAAMYLQRDEATRTFKELIRPWDV